MDETWTERIERPQIDFALSRSTKNHSKKTSGSRSFSSRPFHGTPPVSCGYSFFDPIDLLRIISTGHLSSGRLSQLIDEGILPNSTEYEYVVGRVRYILVLLKDSYTTVASGKKHTYRSGPNSIEMNYVNTLSHCSATENSI